MHLPSEVFLEISPSIILEEAEVFSRVQRRKLCNKTQRTEENIRNYIFYTRRVKEREILYPRQPPTKGRNTVSMTNVVLPALAPPLDFDGGEGSCFFFLFFVHC